MELCKCGAALCPTEADGKEVVECDGAIEGNAALPFEEEEERGGGCAIRNGLPCCCCCICWLGEEADWGEEKETGECVDRVEEVAAVWGCCVWLLWLLW
jgi:hypothetical protein